MPQPAPVTRELVINELFHSIQGESTHQGRPCFFVRLTGCPLRCRWCDTAYAFHEGARWTVDRIVDQARASGARLVEVTGGEPLAQPGVHDLMRRLLEEGFEVLLETSGAFPIEGVDPRVGRIVDMKCPGSQEVHRNRYENLDLLGPRDEVKFVIAHREDYEWARDLSTHHRLAERVPVLMSPVHGELPPERLAGWILEDRLAVRLQVQLHKYLWGATTRGV